MRRYHFMNKDKIKVKRAEEKCVVCGKKKYTVIKKGLIFDKNFGKYCMYEKCVLGDEHSHLKKYLEE